MIAKVLKYVGLAGFILGVARDLLELIKRVESKVDPEPDSKSDKIIKKADSIISELEDLLGLLNGGS